MLTALALSATLLGLQIGQQTWGPPPCGVPHVEVATPEGFDSEPLAWAEPDKCVIVMNANEHIYTRAKRCSVIVHEYLHLRFPDRPHSTNPRSVFYSEDMMFEGTVDGRWVVSQAYKPCNESESYPYASKHR